jgi:hypothetical protein
VFEVSGSVTESRRSCLDFAAADAEGHNGWVGSGEADAAAVVFGVVGDVLLLHGYWISVGFGLKLSWLLDVEDDLRVCYKHGEGGSLLGQSS